MYFDQVKFGEPTKKSAETAEDDAGDIGRST